MDFAERLQALMAERGIGVRALARAVPCDPGLISRLARGKQRPSPVMARRLDDILKASGQLTALAAAAVTPVGTGSTALELAEVARRAGASDVGSAAVELLAEATDGLCRDYPVMPPAVLSDRTRAHLRYVTGLLGKRTTLAEHRELLVMAGWLSALLACCLYDAGDRSAARTARTMARQFADQSGHGVLAAWSFEIGAWFSLVEGRYGETVALSQAGLAYAGTGSAAVQLALQSARGYARMGDKRAHDALREGRAILSRLPVPEHPENHFTFDAGKFEFYAGTILTWLGDDIPAAEHARHVIGTCARPGRWPMRLAMSQLDLAFVTGRGGALDEAVGLALQALACPRRTPQLYTRAAELERELADHYPGEHLVSEFAEQLDSERAATRPLGSGSAGGTGRRR